MKTYQDRIRELREDNDYTQTDIAKELQIRYNVYQRYELGTSKMPIHHLIKLAAFYKVSTDYLLGITNIKEPYPLNMTTKEPQKSVPDVWKNSNSQADHQKP